MCFCFDTDSRNAVKKNYHKNAFGVVLVKYEPLSFDVILS